MALVLADRVRDTTTTTGTGTVTLSGTAPTGYQNFSVIGNGNTTYYTINAGSQWEVGIGTYSSTGPTLARTTVLESSNANALVNFSAGTKDVFVTYPSDRAVTTDGTETLTNKTINGSNNTITNVSLTSAVTGTLPVANGGTGVTTSTGTGNVVLSASPTFTNTVSAANITATGTITVSGGALNSSGAATVGLTATGAITIGSTSSANAITVGQSTASQTLNLATGATASGNTKTINIGTAGLSGSTTNITIGSAVSGATSTTTLNGTVSIASVIAAPLGSAAAPSYTFTGDTNTGMWSPGADTIAFSEGGVEAMRINSSGNVGIGETSPGARLHVSGGTVGTTAGNLLNVTIDQGIAGTNAVGVRTNLVRVSSGTDWTTTAMRLQGRVDATDFGYIDFVSGGAQGLAFGSATSERMRIDSSGNVMVGTTSATGLFSVAGVSYGSMIATDRFGILGNNLYYGTSNFRYISNGHAYGWAQGNTDGADLRLLYAGNNTSGAGAVATTSERIYITSAGRVGIGTSSPAQLLHVNGNALLGGSPAAQYSNVTISGDAAIQSATPLLNFVNAAGSTRFGYLYHTGSGGNIELLNQQAGAMLFGTNNTERARITSAGNVGIGTSSPLYQTTVLGLGQETAALTDAGNKGGSLYLQATGITGGSGGALLFGTTFGNQTPFAAIKGLITDGTANTIGDIAFSTRNATSDTALTERMRILRSGNVGIGTSSPATLLSVNGSVTANENFFAATGGVWFNAANTFTRGIAVAGSDVAHYTSGTERLRITSTGNVGIGTTAPQGLLHVVAGTDNSILIRGPINYATGGSIYAVNSANSVITPMEFGASSYFFAGGNVGIGTSSPGAKLDVSSSTFNIVVSRSTGGYAAFQRFAASGQQAYDFYNINGVEAGRITVDGSNFMAFATGSAAAERMRLNSSGELLVGTTSGGRTVCINAADNWMRFQNPSRAWLIGPSIGTSFNIFDETGGYTVANFDTAGSFNLRNSIDIGNGVNLDNKIQIGAGRTGSNYAYIDLIGDTTYTDYGLRLIRGNTGANTTSQLVHRGTGDMYISAQDAAPIYFQTSGATRMYIEAGGTVQMNGVLLVGRNSASTDVNTANDTGSFSVRGSTTTVAVMSFHRAGAYAINMGLGTDNVFRIGGWSASSNCFQMDGSGNLTMLGNVTAYSDARMKKDVETIDSALDLVSKMRGVRYTRTDTQQRGVGVIAQEMLEVCPEVVQQGIGSDDTLSVAYGNLVGVLIEAVKELTARVAELEGK